MNLARHVAQILETQYHLRRSGDRLRGHCPWRPTSNSGGFVFSSGEHEHDWWAHTWWKDHVTGESGTVFDAATRLGIAWAAR
ncbi:MAG: hypothetical protein HC914_22200, partial [Chloroflexaceae bacterium]|nr:hypothetical protein [Chloroflexaceae bacterium]